MKVLITGYPGWLGNKLVEEALKQDWYVRCLVLRGAKARHDVDVVRGDVRELYSLVEATRDIDLVIHAAGVIHGKPSLLMDVNAYGTLNMLRASVANNVKRFIYISSNSAAGYTKGKELMDEGVLRRPYMAYGKSKYLAEEYVRGFYETGKLKAMILRPTWFYGEGQPARMTKLFKMIQGGRPVIFGDGRNIRSMTYIGNLVEAIFLAVAADDSAWNTSYWISDKRPYTTNEIYETIAELLGVKEYKPVHLPTVFASLARAMDKSLQLLDLYSSYVHVAGEMTLNIACNIAKAKKILGYDPKVSLREGMEKAVKWCKRNKLI